MKMRLHTLQNESELSSVHRLIFGMRKREVAATSQAKAFGVTQCHQV